MKLKPIEFLSFEQLQMLQSCLSGNSIKSNDFYTMGYATPRGQVVPYIYVMPLYNTVSNRQPRKTFPFTKEGYEDAKRTFEEYTLKSISCYIEE